MKFLVKQLGVTLCEVLITDEDILNGGEVFIGREGDCHIQLDSFQVSRYHAKIFLKNNEIKLSSLSTHGVLKINGNTVKSTKLIDNDKIEIDIFEVVVLDCPVLEQESVCAKGAEDVLEDKSKKNIKHEEDIVEQNIEEETDSRDSEVGGGDFAPEVDDELTAHEGSESFLENEDENKNEDEDEDIFQDQIIMSDDGIVEETLDEPLKVESMDTSVEDLSADSFKESDEFSNEDSFSNDSFGSEESSDLTQVMKTFANFSLKIFGEHAPFDRFLLEDSDVFIGRDEKECQIILDDAEVSKIHAVIKKTGMSYELEDLDSANGIILNGERINKAILVNGSEFVIGETSFSVEVLSDIIEAERGALMPVADNQEVEIEEIVEEEVDFADEANLGGDSESEDKSLIKKIMNDPKKKRIAIFGAIIFLFLILFEEDSLKEAPSQEKVAKGITKVEGGKKTQKKEKKFTPDVLEKLEQNYALALTKFNTGEYYEAKEYIGIVASVDPTYKDSQSLLKLIQEGLDQLVNIKLKEKKEEDRRERQVRVNKLLEKAKKAVKNKEVNSANNFFNLIFELDPENIDVPALKLEIEAYVEAQRRKKQNETIIKSKRQGKIDRLAPAKSLYLKGDWHKAIDRLEKFLVIKNMDEDLIKDATNMLQKSKERQHAIIGPLLSKARSYKEGQDLKQAFETFGDVLKFDPPNEEALNERNNIFENLRNRSRKIYREALVAESLSLFGKAKEKFQEVQQVSPINSEYFNKATEKLKNYLE